MQTHKGQGTGRFRWGYLLAMLGLIACLLTPGALAAQGIKDRPSDDDPATEEATEEDDSGSNGGSGDYNWEDFEDVGMTAEDAYESPQFGYTVEWAGDWVVDEYYLNDDGDDSVDPIMSDEDNEQDRLYLIWSGGSDEWAYAILSGESAGRGGADADVEEWTNPEYIEQQWDANFDVEAILDDTTRDSGAVLFSVVDTDNDDAQYYTIYQSVELEDGTTLYLTFSAFEDWFEDSYTAWSEDIQLNGEPLPLVFAWADIEDAIGA